MQLTETEQRMLEEAEQRLREELRNAPPIKGEGYHAPLTETIDACRRILATPATVPDPGLVAVLDRLLAALVDLIPVGAVWADYRPTEDILPILRRLREVVAAGVPSPELEALAREMMQFFGLAPPPAAPPTPGSGAD